MWVAGSGRSGGWSSVEPEVAVDVCAEGGRPLSMQEAREAWRTCARLVLVGALRERGSGERARAQPKLLRVSVRYYQVSRVSIAGG